MIFIQIYRNWIVIIILFHVWFYYELVKHSIVKLKSEGDEEENLKETYINANFINVLLYNMKVNKWKRENDCSNIRTINLNI